MPHAAAAASISLPSSGWQPPPAAAAVSMSLRDDSWACSGDSAMCEMSVTAHDIDKGRWSVFEMIRDNVRGHDDRDVYTNGKHIACVKYSQGPGGFCLFFEGVKKGSGTMAQVHSLLNELEKKSCSKCAWIRVSPDDPQDKGVLKLDYVGKVDCDPSCGPR
ncbi:hypothetical protein JDV02_005045 [Purpureocillium takamizusanense]|uniref:Killer toxin Kp4 domain-containing protein n=1 Tax=Purpureocillium takamizusanense TaxID=2060973 RepID=A0A9Q8QH58_9HYPO|nr:uncharacterized protein JDV02_005045 [Purpureocillium takamizusanense]UNI18796.1 hypothetical protein JDV02_005045 [Purpureocillium takamizusanense]